MNNEQAFIAESQKKGFIMDKDTMILRAQANAKSHGINVIAGSPNPGRGDCALEVAILNNNDRYCLKQKYTL